MVITALVVVAVVRGQVLALHALEHGRRHDAALRRGRWIVEGLLPQPAFGESKPCRYRGSRARERAWEGIEPVGAKRRGGVPSPGAEALRGLSREERAGELDEFLHRIVETGVAR